MTRLQPPLINGITVNNPYKFSVYRTAALNSPNNGAAAVAFDTERFDTNNNFDITTNVGRYTVPISGFYHFNASLFLNGTIRAFISLNVNGTEIIRGSDYVPTATSPLTLNLSCLVQLTAGQYVEISVYTPSSIAFEVSGASLNNFEGFLVCTT